MSHIFRRGTDFRHQAHPWLATLLMILLAVTFFWPGAAFIPATDRDESRYVEASRQMATSGDWVDIHFQDETRYKKPIGIYWAEAAAVKLFGENPLNPVSVYRWPSLIGGSIAVIATYFFAASFNGALVGIIASFVLASTLLLNVEARLATPDALLLAAITLAYAALYRIGLSMEADMRPARIYIIMFWAAIGIGVLLKGPMIVLMLGLSVAALKFMQKDKPWLNATRPAYGVWLALAIAAPWFVAIYLRSGWSFFADALGHDFAGKLAHAQENHFAPPGSYLLALPLIFWPGSLLLLMGLPYLWNNRRVLQRHFLLAWIVPNWIVLEIVPTKLPHYILPLFPALATLTAISIAANYHPPKLWRIVTILLYALATSVLAAALGLSTIYLGIDIDYQSLPIKIVAIVTAGFAVAIAAAMYVASRHDDQRLIVIATLTTLIVYGAAFGLIVPSIAAPFLSRTIAEHRAALPADFAHNATALVGYHEPSAVVWLGENTLLAKPEEAAQAMFAGNVTLVIVAAKDDAAFRQAAQELDMKIKLLDTAKGNNFAKGKALVLNFYSREP